MPAVGQGMEGSERLRVMFVITGLGVGGAERVVVDLADSLSDEGHSVGIAYLKGPASVRPRNSAIPLVDLGLDGVAAIPRGTRALRKAIMDFRPDVVHSHLVHANIFVRCARLLLDIPRLISTAHNTNEESKVRMWAYRATNWLADLSTNVSRDAVSAFERDGAVPIGHMRVVHNGIDVNRFNRRPDMRTSVRERLGVPPDKQLLLAVGRLETPKNYATLLDALRQVREVREDWVCAIAGEGPLRAALERQIIDAGLTTQVHLLGMRRDIPELLSATDLFVLASAWEGFPLVIGEAMASSLPVVATDCGGVAEFLGDEKRYLVPPKNPQALAAALLQALADSKEERRRMGEANRARVVAEFSLAATVERWLAVYQEVMQHTRRAH